MAGKRAKAIKWAGGILSFLLIVGIGLGTSVMTRAAGLTEDENKLEAYAKTEDGYTEMSGITVKTTTDKESYSSGDKAVLTMEVKNTNTFDVSEVELTYRFPSNFEVDSSSKAQTIETLKAGETQKFSLNATVTEDTGAPMTTGFLVLIIVGASVAVIAVAVIVLLVIKKKKSKKSGGDVSRICPDGQWGGSNSAHHCKGSGCAYNRNRQLYDR